MTANLALWWLYGSSAYRSVTYYPAWLVRSSLPLLVL